MAEEMIKTHIELYGEYKRDDDFIEKLLKDAQNLEDKEKKINSLIEKIQDPIIQAIIKERFVNGETWENISYRVGYSLAHIHRLFKKAMQDPKILKIKLLFE